MVDGVHGEAMIPAVDLVTEVLNTDTDRATLHLHNMEEILALVHHPNLLAAIRRLVQVRKYVKRYEFLILDSKSTTT